MTTSAATSSSSWQYHSADRRRGARGDHKVAARTVGTTTLNHPVVGELVLDWDTYTANSGPDQHLTVWTAAPGSPTHERLRILASRAAEQNLSPSSALA